MKTASRSHPWRTLATLLVTFAVGLLLVGFGIATRSPTGGSPDVPASPDLVVEARSVAWRTSYTVPRSFVGRVEARQESDLGFEIPGMTAEIPVEEGDVVAAGTIIARLDTARLRARRVELAAARDQARARFDLAEITRSRTREARELDAVSALEMDRAEKDRIATEADWNRAEAALASIDVDLDKTVLRSPFPAVVARRYVDRGRVVAVGTPIVRLFERTEPEVRIGVSGGAVETIEIGQELPVTIRNETHTGTVKAILPTRDRVSRDVDVVLTLDAELDGIRRGDLARITLERTREARGYWLPLQALTEGQRGLWAIYGLVDADGDRAVLSRQDVEILHQEADRVFVRGAQTEGDRIVTGGLHRVVPGLPVRFRMESAGGRAGS